MLDCHSPNEDMFFAFLQTDGADLSASMLFTVNFKKTHPIVQIQLAFLAQGENARSALEPACML